MTYDARICFASVNVVFVLKHLFTRKKPTTIKIKVGWLLSLKLLGDKQLSTEQSELDV